MAIWAASVIGAASVASAAVSYDVAEGKVAQTVAKDLKSYLQRRTFGGVFTIDGRDPVIHVGDTAFAKEKGLLSDGMKDEEWVIRSFGGDLVLNGKGRGLSLAVGNFFDDDCGIRFWSEYEEFVPTGDLKLGTLNRQGRPAFSRRDVYTTPKNRPHEGRFCAYTGLNRCDEDYGPVPRYGTGGCHSFARYLPADKHFKAHPEWYMMDKSGRRTVQQPCLTHPEVRAEFKRMLRVFIAGDRANARKNGTAIPAVYDISQNDNNVYCVCPTCKEVIAKKGCSGLLLEFINDIAASVKDDYPYVRVMTFAYLWSVEPPMDDTRAADNVIVRFCNTESNLAGSILDADNTWLLKMLEGWTPHAREFYVWDYAVTYSKGSLGFPMPGEFGLKDLFRTYRKYNVTSVFMEHEQQHRSDMWELKYRLETKLMQDPDADANAIIDDFMVKYYGPAGDKVLAYRKYLWQTRFANGGFVRWIPAGDFGYIRTENLVECNRLMDEAEALVAKDETYLARVRRARLGLDLLTIQRERIAGRGTGALAKKAAGRVNADWAKWISRYPDKDGWKRFELMSAVGLPPPPQFAGRNIVDFPAILIKDPEPENGGDTVDDLTSTVGLARRLCWDHGENEHFALPFSAGIWDNFTKHCTVAKNFEKPQGEGWHWYHIGTGRVSANATIFMTRSWLIWVASSRFVETWDKDWDMWVSAKFTGPKYGFTSADGKSHVWIDRMILVEPDAKDAARNDK